MPRSAAEVDCWGRPRGGGGLKRTKEGLKRNEAGDRETNEEML